MFRTAVHSLFAVLLAALLIACGGGGDQSVDPGLAAILVPPEVSAGPVAQTVHAGQQAQFHVAATSSTELSYQWIRDGAPIAGATGTDYVTPRTALADNGAAFSVAVRNAAGAITTPAALLTVLP